MDRVAIALGSNVGDRAGHLEFAAAGLARFITPLRISRWYETEPVGIEPAGIDVGHRFSGANLFLNGAAVGETTLSARELLDALLALERERGRERPFPGAPRTLDLDLVLFGDQVLDEPALIVPHPRFRERRFVLGPLAEISPEMIDPVTRLTVRQLLSAL